MPRRGAAAIVAAARSQVGFVPAADGLTPYGRAVGYDGLPWAGALVDWAARSSSVRLPAACRRPADGLAGFLREGRLVGRPAPGDVVFYAFSTTGPLGGPHVGVVTDVARWSTDGSFRAVEGDVPSGLPRGGSTAGVFERTRFATDVLAFGRPGGSRGSSVRAGAARPLVTVAHLTTGRRARAVESVQSALAACTEARGLDRGRWCARTRSAFAAYQRRAGRLGADATGLPDADTLARLSAETGLFRVTDDA